MKQNFAFAEDRVMHAMPPHELKCWIFGYEQLRTIAQWVLEPVPGPGQVGPKRDVEVESGG